MVGYSLQQGMATTSSISVHWRHISSLQTFVYVGLVFLWFSSCHLRFLGPSFLHQLGKRQVMDVTSGIPALGKNLLASWIFWGLIMATNSEYLLICVDILLSIRLPVWA